MLGGVDWVMGDHTPSKSKDCYDSWKKRADRIVDPLIQNSEHVAKLDQHLLGRRFGGLNN